MVGRDAEDGGVEVELFIRVLEGWDRRLGDAIAFAWARRRRSMM